MRYAAILGLLALAVSSSAFVPAQLRQNRALLRIHDLAQPSNAVKRIERRSSTRLYYTTDHPDFYEILGVSRSATPKEIKSAYHQKARQYHPDANPGLNTVELFKDINRAHEVLNDPYLKQKYDMYGDNENGVGTGAYSDTAAYSPVDARAYSSSDYRESTKGWPFRDGRGYKHEATSGPFGGSRQGFGRDTTREYRASDGSGYKHDATSGPFGGSTTFGKDTTREYRASAEYRKETVRNPFGFGVSGGFGQAADPDDPSVFFKKGFEQEVAPPRGPSETVEEFFSTMGAQRDPSQGPVVDIDDLRMDLDGFLRDGSSHRRHANRGQVGDDLRFDLEVDLKTACYGGEEKIIIQHLEACDACSGTRVHTGTCSACNGLGVSFHMTQSLHGVRQNEKICSRCHGTGKQVEQHCTRCSQQGLQHKIKELTVNIPAGVEDFTKLRVRGEGNAGPNGGPPGDLIIYVKVREHPTSRRVGPELYSESSIDIVDAIFGASIKCPVVNGEITIDVEPGTQSGDVVRLKGSGAPKLGQPDVRGDHHVTVNVQIPTNLSKEEEAIFIKLRDLRDSRSMKKHTVFGVI